MCIHQDNEDEIISSPKTKIKIKKVVDKDGNEKHVKVDKSPYENFVSGKD